MGNVNIQHTFGKGQVINTNLDYLTYNNANPTQYLNQFYDNQEMLARSDENRISKDTPINIWVAKLDYSMNISNSVTLETGIKGTFSNLINDIVLEEKKEKTGLLMKILAIMRIFRRMFWQHSQP